jgi:hypothetical protein
MTYATNSDKPSIEERYVAATNSRDLSLKPQARTDADILLAAGYAAAGNGRASLALAFYRLKATGDLAEFRALSNIAGAWLHGRSMRRGRKKMRMIEACDLASRVLFWWIGPSCTPCEGRWHPLMPNSPVINPGHDCPVCRGTGQYPIHRIVPPGTADEARWLVDEIDQHCGIIFSDMGRLLAARLEL